MEKKEKVFPLLSIDDAKKLYNELHKFLPKELAEILICSTKAPMYIGYYIESLAKKMGWKPAKMAGYLDNLWKLNPSAAFSILLREIAIELDKQYKDHINTCKEFFVVSTMDGRIHKVPRAHAKNFRNFAAFRTEEDAKIACRILKEDLKDMFKGGGKQED